jgi:hypothetical protein
VGGYAAYNRLTVGQFRYIAPEYKAYAVRENMVQLEAVTSGRDYVTAYGALLEEARISAGIDGRDWSLTSLRHRDFVVEEQAKQLLRAYDPGALARAMVLSVIRFHAGTGTHGVVSFLRIEQDLGVDLHRTPAKLTDWIRRALGLDPWLGLLTIGFYSLSRVLLVLGAFAAFRSKDYAPLVLVGVYALYFTGFAGFLGFARYRLPVDALFFFLGSMAVGQHTRKTAENSEVLR